MSNQITKQTKPTIRQVAKRAGVSLGTVSRVLNGFDSVSPENVRLVKDAATKLRYNHKLDPWKPVRRKALSRTIMAPVNRQHPQWHVDRLLSVGPCRYFEKDLNQRGFRLCFQYVEHDQMHETIDSLAHSPQQCDGILILGRICSEAIAEVIKQAHFPHICFDYLAEQYDINTVRTHAAEGMRRAVEHLYNLGHRHIGFLGAFESERYPLALTALAEKRLSLDGISEGERHFTRPNTSTVTFQDWRNAGQEALESWIRDGLDVSALICSNDEVAMGAVEALRRNDITPGRELSLIGYDNAEVRGLEPTEHPILTTIDNPTDRIGRRMAQFLLNQILQGQTQIVHERLPAKLIVRQTTGPCMDAQPGRPLMDSACDNDYALCEAAAV